MRLMLRTFCAIAIALPLTTMGTAAYSATPAPPTGVTVKTESDGFRVTWRDSINDKGYQIGAAYSATLKHKAERNVKQNVTAYKWTAGPGQQLCFQVRAVSGSSYSAWTPTSGGICAFLPGMRFPWPKGAKIYLSQAIGAEPHPAGFPQIKDDASGFLFNIEKATMLAALDFTLYPPVADRPPATSSVSVRTVAWGKVLAVWSSCHMVLMDHSAVPGDVDYWAAYLHVDKIAVHHADVVGAGEPIGQATNDESTCGLRSDAYHVHLTLIAPHSIEAGEYVSMVDQGRIFCLKNKVSKGTATGVVFSGLTTSQNDPFITPC